MKQGATAPYLCSADNGKKYVIKRQRAGFEGCIKEWLFGKLGHYFGLPIPSCELVYVDRSLLEYNDTYQFEIGEGMAFASEHVPDLQEVNYQILQSDGFEAIASLLDQTNCYKYTYDGDLAVAINQMESLVCL
jgi:hypothetical protein